MKFVIAPDSYKETLTAKEAAGVMTAAVNDTFPGAEAVSLPVADGGEGTAECLAAACGGETVAANVTFPDGSEGRAFFAVLPDGTAVVDAASAAGIGLTRGRVLPDRATTFGVGRLIAAAAARCTGNLLVGLGGSGTHDFGCGCAAALGVRFTDKTGKDFVPTGATLTDVSHVDISDAALPRDLKLTLLCDVDNPPYGDNGAAFVFAPQKGADGITCRMLDEGTRHMCKVIKSDLGTDVSDLKGGGAAGALAAGLHAFFGAGIKRGIDAVLDACGFDGALSGADLVFTGEGKTDAQTLSGKAVAGVAARAKAANVRVAVVAGYFEDAGDLSDRLKELGVWRVYSVTDGRKDIEALKKTAARDLYLRMKEILLGLKAENEI